MSGTDVRDAAVAAAAAFLAAHDALAACDIDLLTATELLTVEDGIETVTRQLPTQSHRVLARLQVETTAKELGAKSWRDVLAIRWRLSAREAGRRLAEAAVLGPRRSLIGEALEPVLPATAAAQAHGAITAEHVDIIRKAMDKLPSFVDAATAAQIEVDWARLAAKVSPKELLDGIELRLFLLDQDGPEPDDTERQRKRGLSIGKQGRDGTSKATGWLTPEAKATWEPILAKYAAPGMCNPDDPEPCTSGTPTQAQIDNDHRSIAQRNHDAFLVVGRIALMCGELGQLNGLPVSIIIRTTLQDLEARAGVGVSGGGTKMSARDVLRLAGHAHLFLAVFDKATGSAMDLFRAKRVASLAQRIMLIGREGGCTKPGCTVGPYGCQVHHAVADWADDGQTNVDDMGLACGPDNRMVDKNGGWTTQMSDKHEVEWIPPPHLDTGQTRINHYHRPETLLSPTEEPESDDTPEPQRDNNTGDNAKPEPDMPPQPAPIEQASDNNTATGDPQAPDAPTPEPGDGKCKGEDSDDGDGDGDESEPFDPWAHIPEHARATATAPTESTSDESGEDDRVPPEPFDPWADVTASRPEAEAEAEAEQDSAPEPFDPWAPDTVIDLEQSTPPDDYTAQCRSPQPPPNEPPTPGPFDPPVPEYDADLASPRPDRDQPTTPGRFGPLEMDFPAESDEPAPAYDDTAVSASAEPPPPQDNPAEPPASGPFNPWKDASTEPGGPAPPDGEVA